MRSLFIILLLGILGITSLAQTAPLPVRLLAEAEDFTVKDRVPARGQAAVGWGVLPYRENYYASTFAITFLSRMGCLSAPEQLPEGKTTVAEQQVTIPSAGDYRVLARYEQPYNYSCEFTVEVVQKGKVVGRYDFGRLDDPKIWGLNGGKEVPMVRYWWGGTDNIVWQNPGSAKLEAGPAILRLIAATQLDGGKPRVNAAKRNVDVVMLTTDLQGIEVQKKVWQLPMDGWLTLEGDLYARFTNPKDGLGPCVPEISPRNVEQHSPWDGVPKRDWTATRVLKSGILPDPNPVLTTGPRSGRVKAKLLAPILDPAMFTVTDEKTKKTSVVIPDTEYLQPGDASSWVPAGQVLDSLHNCMWGPGATYKAGVKGIDLQVEFAVPDGKGGLKTLRTARVKGDSPGDYRVRFEIPASIDANPALAKALKERWWQPGIMTAQEALVWLKSEVDKFPKIGKTPDRFMLYSIGGFGSTPRYPEGRELMLALGDNTVVNQEGRKRDLVAHWPDVSPKYYENAKVDDVRVISYGDETHLPPADLTDDEFAAWLKNKGIAYGGKVEYIGIKRDDPAEVVKAKRAHPLYYYSVIAGVEKGAQPYIQASDYYFKKGALTGANYSPHANYLVSEMHWVRPFKMNAMTMAWSEDYVWQIPEFSVQVVGYMMTAFRCGTKYHNQPIMMYVMPHSPGNTPADFRRAFYTDLAHGMKMANYFAGSPMATGGTENYIATHDLKMWREVYNVSHEAGIFEDYVIDGKVRNGKVGIILSSVDDVMTDSTNSTFAMHNNERKAIYYALRHAQVPVDMLSEDDVIDGLAKDYQVIYVCQQWMHSKALVALQKWVENGGTVVSLAGGGFLDEFNKPNPAANAFYGVRGQELTRDPDLVKKYLLVENTPFLTKQDLPLYQPIDYVKWTGKAPIENVPVIVWKQKLAAADGQVLGTFTDGSPAVVRKTHGKGRAVLFGFLPGQAYLKSGLPIRPADRGSSDDAFTHFLPTEMDKALRARIVDDFLPAGFTRPVECSEPLVETTCIDTPTAALQDNSAGIQARLGVPLINYTGKPIAKLTVTIAGLGAAKSVRSIERGVLKPTFQNGNMTVELPLEVADMLLIDR